jgi:methylated-DNA-[protein]-cysteine S-methyltransferase
MKTAFFKSIIGMTRISGDDSGISEISINNEEAEITSKIPKSLPKAIEELHEYLDGNRTNFTFKLNLKGTDF